MPFGGYNPKDDDEYEEFPRYGSGKCLGCGKLATWMRYTQFAGNHPFCDEHAELESDFMDGDWERIDDD